MNHNVELHEALYGLKPIGSIVDLVEPVSYYGNPRYYGKIVGYIPVKIGETEIEFDYCVQCLGETYQITQELIK